METITHNPTDGVYSTDNDWVHAIEVRGAERLLFVSGTMGLDPDGVPGATLEQQLDLAWANLRTILASAGLRRPLRSRPHNSALGVTGDRSVVRPR